MLLNEKAAQCRHRIPKKTDSQKLAANLQMPAEDCSLVSLVPAIVVFNCSPQQAELKGLTLRGR